MKIINVLGNHEISLEGNYETDFTEKRTEFYNKLNLNWNNSSF